MSIIEALLQELEQEGQTTRQLAQFSRSSGTGLAMAGANRAL